LQFIDRLNEYRLFADLQTGRLKMRECKMRDRLTDLAVALTYDMYVSKIHCN